MLSFFSIRLIVIILKIDFLFIITLKQTKKTPTKIDIFLIYCAAEKFYLSAFISQSLRPRH